LKATELQRAARLEERIDALARMSVVSCKLSVVRCLLLQNLSRGGLRFLGHVSANRIAYQRSLWLRADSLINKETK